MRVAPTSSQRGNGASFARTKRRTWKCVIRTVFSSIEDLEAALPSVLASDGSCFVPAQAPRVELGERVSLLFTVVDSSAGVRRLAIVIKALYDGQGPGGRSGFAVQVLPPDDDEDEGAAPLPFPSGVRRRAPDDAIVPANPLAGLDSHMVALFIDFNLTEHIPSTTPLDEVPAISSEALPRVSAEPSGPSPALPSPTPPSPASAVPTTPTALRVHAPSAPAHSGKRGRSRTTWLAAAVVSVATLALGLWLASRALP